MERSKKKIAFQTEEKERRNKRKRKKRNKERERETIMKRNGGGRTDGNKETRDINRLLTTCE